MNELSIFTGVGGGIIASKLYRKHRIIGYVEHEIYCQKIIEQRIKDGHTDKAPIFGDIGLFISEGYTKLYKGITDIISAGFPCQPFSVSGSGKAENDPRNKWPETLKCIDIIRPKFAELENVPGLVSKQYIKRIFGDLAKIGYNAAWSCLSAANVGACHKRERLFILAYTDSLRKPQ